MARFIKDRMKAKGKPPGSLIFIGQQKVDQPRIHLMNYHASAFQEKDLESIEACWSYLDEESVSWINVYGIHDTELMQKIGDKLGLHPLLLEDILNTDQMPKLEEGPGYLAFILKMLAYERETETIHAEQVTLILGKNYVLTLQEKPGDVFEPVRDRIRNHGGRVRLNHNDYLAYALLDTLVDQYIYLIETVGRKIEALEEDIFYGADRKIAEKIYHHKIELNYLRKNIRPVKEVMNHLFRTELSLFQEKNHRFLEDLDDLTGQATEAIELYNSIVSDQLNIYHTNMSNRMNEVMKVLTIFASIFIPLTFMAGIYGMNFEHMPELGYKYAYPVFWLAILLVGGGLVWFFWRKRWL